jgi:hypothetical protein
MKHLKSSEEFNESFFGKVKNFFGNNQEVETGKEPETELKPSDKYRELVDQIKTKFDEPSAIDYYMKELQKIGKWQEFITSEEGEHFKKMVNAFRK